MGNVHTFFRDNVKLGKKGQITIPKKIRDEDGLKDDDEFTVTHTPGGEIVLRKAVHKAPEDELLELIRTFPRFDWRTAWEEVREERRQSDR